MAKGRASPTKSGSLSVLKTSADEEPESIPATFFMASFSMEQAPRREDEDEARPLPPRSSAARHRGLHAYGSPERLDHS